MDLTSWVWERATGAAVAVLVAATLGLALGTLGGFVAGATATIVVYGAGPVVAVIERRRWSGAQVPTPQDLYRHWGVTAVIGVLVLGMLSIGSEGLLGLGVAVLATALGVPIAVGATVGAVQLGPRLPRRVGRPLALAVPAALVAAVGWEATGTPGHGLDLVDGALVLAVVALVPLALPLGVPGDRDRRTAVALVVLLAGGWAAVAVVVDPGPLAAAAATPWLVTAGALAIAAAVRWLRRPTRDHLVVAVAAAYLAVGAAWLVADRAGLEPAGFGPPFVQLTAVHFTYAGAVGTVLARLAWRRLPSNRAAAGAVVATTAAPPLVAAGFVAYGPLQVAGAVLLTAGTYAYAWVVLRHLVRRVERVAGWLLGASAASVLVPMLLAVQWAVGANLGTPALSIPAMAATHGVANALGFCLVGVLGWRRVDQLTAEDGAA